jgi:iron complex transport system ATP-binding protein
MTLVAEFRDVAVVRDGNRIVSSVSWSIQDDQRWVVIGPNGAGKTTLLQMLAAQEHPSTGTVTILGERLGQGDLFELRPRIGFASTAMARKIPANETVLNVVMTAAWAVTGRWNEEYDDVDERRARRVLREWKLDHLVDRTFGTLSDGEQKRTMIARAIMTDPEILLLDEPAASLDLGAREELVQLLGEFASSDMAPVIVMVTHHVEEIPAGFTHVLVMSKGTIHAAGPISEVLTSSVLTEAFGIPLTVTKTDGRYTARGSVSI